MIETSEAIMSSACVLLAVPIGRTGWSKMQATLYYESNRLIKVEGIDFTQTGPSGVTGSLYLVKESLCRENRRTLRIERQKVVNGLVVDIQNWGEIEESVPQAA